MANRFNPCFPRPMVGLAAMSLGAHLHCASPATPAPDAASDVATSDDSPTDVAPSDASDAFAVADHEPAPQVANFGGMTMPHPRVVTVTFPSYPYADQVDAFGRWIVASDWLTTVGRDYGVASATYGGHVALSTPPATRVLDADIATLLASHVADGTLPAPDDQTLYVVFFPSMTTVVDHSGVASCTAYLGYHRSAMVAGHTVAYAVIATCESPDFPPEQEIEYAASHELIEVATDPFTPHAWAFDDPASNWTSLGHEIADLCQVPTAMEGFTVTRVWSNSAAAAGLDPCVPSPASPQVYANLDVAPAGPQSIAAGSSMQFTLTGWTAAPRGDWEVEVVTDDASFHATTTLSASRINNGRSVTLTVSVPASAGSGQSSLLYIYSSAYTGEDPWPLMPLRINVL